VLLEFLAVMVFLVHLAPLDQKVPLVLLDKLASLVSMGSVALLE